MLPIKNTTQRYGIISQLFHWIIAALVVTNFYLVYRRAYIPETDPSNLAYILTHKEFGVTILVLAILWLLWRVFNTKPPLPANTSSGQRRLAYGVHHLLLVLIILMPIAGITMSILGGRPTHVFGLFTIPALAVPNKFWAGIVFDMHVGISILIIAAVSLHILGALRHHFILHDNVLRRILPVKLKKE